MTAYKHRQKEDFDDKRLLPGIQEAKDEKWKLFIFSQQHKQDFHEMKVLKHVVITAEQQQRRDRCVVCKIESLWTFCELYIFY